jgi:hypothetical protein
MRTKEEEEEEEEEDEEEEGQQVVSIRETVRVDLFDVQRPHAAGKQSNRP